MKVVALVSGGKDSCYAMMKCIEYGHEIVALANLLPADDSVDELDSYMYQTVGHQIIVSYAECMGVPLFRRRIQGSSRHQKLSYQKTSGDEVEDMFILLNEVKRQIPLVSGVSSGAIASDYQRLRVESICSRLGLVSLAYLWKQDQSLLLQEMIENDIQAITVKVAALGLDPAKHLGKEIKFLNPYLHKLKELYGINVCGEGGEYETLTLDCPLFTDARIILDDYRVILHSPNSIAPVGVLHPLTYHLENKTDSTALTGTDNCNGFSQNKSNLVFEVHDDCPQSSQTTSQCSGGISIPTTEAPESKFHSAKTRKSNTFSYSCWLQDSCESSTDVQEDMRVVLKKVESKLQEFGLGWENVLYIHLYIANMKEFATANQTYVKFITHDNCPYGVPSRSTIELPLPQVGLGKAYVELLLSNDQSKRVLHVQSISSWAPSCIGPYSQATVYNEVLHMAGQLGLDPPTMTLCGGGPGAELEQALKNSEAVAECFRCSISTSAILFVVYCSTSVQLSDRFGIQEKLNTFLEKTRQLNKERGLVLLGPIFLYILVPELPKSAHVEIKPILYVADEADTADETTQEPSCTLLHSNFGYQHAQWHDSCVQKCVVNGKICVANLHITGEHAEKIYSESPSFDQNRDLLNIVTGLQLEKVSKFCIYLLDRILAESAFCWEDITSLRIYFPTSLDTSLEALLCVFSKSFTELAEMSPRISLDKEPIFNLVPVLGAGDSATCMNDIITCELFAQKS